MRHDAIEINEYTFPSAVKINGIKLPVNYEFTPGKEGDGVHIDISIENLNQLNPRAADFLVPGLLLEKIIFLLKQLPKNSRKLCVPVPETAGLFIQELDEGSSLVENIVQLLFKHKGVDIKSSIWKDVEYPAHLQINYRLFDLQKKLLSQKKDLDGLKQEFVAESNKVFSLITGDEFSERQVTDWDFGFLKSSNAVTFNGEKRTIYSGLEFRDNNVYFKFFESLEEVERNLAPGLRQLYLHALEKEFKYLKKNLPEFNKVKLICAKSVQHEDIWHDFLILLIDMTCMDRYQDVLSKDAFFNIVDNAKKQLISNANDLLTTLLEIMESYDKAHSKLICLSAGRYLDNSVDIEEQLHWLIYDGFLQETPINRLVHYPRYLNGISKRIEKLEDSIAKDTQKMNQVLPYWEKAKLATEKMLETGMYNGQIEEFRWMLEEYRVSLFAQELKTIFPVSAKRLDKYWQQIQED